MIVLGLIVLVVVLALLQSLQVYHVALDEIAKMDAENGSYRAARLAREALKGQSRHG